jgi:hypothetical protein
VAIVVVLLIACSPSIGARAAGAAVAPFGAPVSLTAAEGNALAPQVAVNARGDAVAVWYEWVGEGSVVRSSWRPAGGSWSPAVALSTTDGVRFIHDVDVALTSKGEAIAVWTGTTGPNVDVGVVQTATGSASDGWSAASDITRLPGYVSSVRLAATPKGEAAAVWWYSGFGRSAIQAATRSAGGSWSAAVDLSAAGTQGFLPDVGIADNGEATVVWTISTSVARAVQTATYVGGAWSATRDLTGPDGALIFARVAFSGKGDAIAAWSRGTNYEGVVAATVRLAGGDWSAPRDLAGGGAFFPDVAIGDRAQAIVVWEQSWLDGTRNAIDAAMRRPDGSWTEPVELDGFGSQVNVAMTGRGEAVAVWSAWNVIRSATMMTDGTWSAASDVATGPIDKAMEGPEVAVSDKGQAVAVWYRFTPGPPGPPFNVIQAAAND